MHHGSEPQTYSHGVMLGKEQPPSSTIHMNEIWNNRFLELIWQKVGSALMCVLLCSPTATKMELSSAPDNTNMFGPMGGVLGHPCTNTASSPHASTLLSLFQKLPNQSPDAEVSLCSSVQWLALWQTLPVSSTEVVPGQLWAAVHQSTKSSLHTHSGPAYHHVVCANVESLLKIWKRKNRIPSRYSGSKNELTVTQKETKHKIVTEVTRNLLWHNWNFYKNFWTL